MKSHRILLVGAWNEAAPRKIQHRPHSLGLGIQNMIVLNTGIRKPVEKPPTAHAGQKLIEPTTSMKPLMKAKSESRKSERFRRECLIMLGDELELTPYYAVSKNVSAGGMYFKSLFELNQGACVQICIDDHSKHRKRVQARVVWCKKLENTKRFQFGVGVEFLRPTEDTGMDIAPSDERQMTSLTTLPPSPSFGRLSRRRP